MVSIAAKNIHKTLAPWCLKAYCDLNAPNSEVVVQESNINEPVSDIIGKIYRSKPDVLGLSVYIWNAEVVQKITSCIKKMLPDCIVVLGGPEVSFEDSFQNYPDADYIIKGAGEIVFCELVNSLTTGTPIESGILIGGETDINEMPSPYTEAFFESFNQKGSVPIENQLIYYESSRGCPFNCSYCLSCTSENVSYLPVKRVTEDLYKLVERGAKCIKFVDRTFNANKSRAAGILETVYYLHTDCVFHFEAAANLFDRALLAIAAAMPVNKVQFEIGIQSVNPATLKAVNRRANINIMLEKIARLSSRNNCHIHVDLIAGLPFETKATFADAVEKCLSAKPHMLQLGFLKMLKGSKIRTQSNEFGYVFSDFPPYEVLKTDTMSADDLILFKSIERVIDKFYNSGYFVNSLEFAANSVFSSYYKLFECLAEYCDEIGNLRLSLKNSYGLLLNFLTKYTSREEAEHYIKLDCLTFDLKGSLPEAITPNRDKAKEADLRQRSKYKGRNIRVEFFPLDGIKRLFIYENKHPITKRYDIVELEHFTPSVP